jgi:hypothetical protein
MNLKVPLIYQQRLQKINKDYSTKKRKLQSEKNGKEFYKAKVLEIYQTLEITKDREDISEKRKAEIISNKLLLMEDYVAKYDTIDSELSKLSDKFDNEIIKIRNMIKQSVPELSDDDVTAYIEKYIIKFD